MMLLRPPPLPPYWPAYPEPERSRLEASYRAEHAKYCAEIEQDMIVMLCAVIAGIVISGAVLLAACAS